MAKTIKQTENPSIEKDKVLTEVKKLINDKCVKLNTKYLHSHDKVAIMYEGHVIEIIGGAEKQIRYLALNIPLTPAEHKEIHTQFMDEVKKRKETDSLKKFDQLKSLLKG